MRCRHVLSYMSWRFFDDLTGRGKAHHLLSGPVCMVIAIRSMFIPDWRSFVIAAAVASCEQFMFFLPLIIEVRRKEPMRRRAVLPWMWK